MVWQGRFIAAKRRGKWEYVSRTRGVSAAVILADRRRPRHPRRAISRAARRACLELPAGLIGDEEEGEEVEAAAIRELEEETGYRAERDGRPRPLSIASPGMSSEGFTLLRAEGLTKVGEGGGVAGEDIVVHRVPLADVPAFVAAKRAEGCAIDVEAAAAARGVDCRRRLEPLIGRPFEIVGIGLELQLALGAAGRGGQAMPLRSA